MPRKKPCANLAIKSLPRSRSDVEAKVAEVKKAAQGEDVAAIKSATEALGEAIQKIGAAVYQGQDVPGGMKRVHSQILIPKPDRMLLKVK